MKDEPAFPIFCAAHELDSWDERRPQAAFTELAGSGCPVRRDGTLVVAARQEVADFLRHPAVRATDGVHFNLGGKRPLIPLDLDGDVHRKYRRLLDPLFTPKRVARLEPVIRARTNELIDAFADEGSADLMPALCGPLPTHLFIDLLGLPTADLPVFLRFKEAVVRPQGATEEEQQAGMRAAGDRMYAYLEAVLAERRAQPPRDDLIGGFLTTEHDGRRLTDQEIIDVCYLLVIAGLDTVTSALSCLLAWFAEHPAERRRVVADPGLLPRVVEELMRFESPVPLAHRWVTEDIEVGGRSFPAGSKVEVVWAAANADPAAFPDPLTVDFARPRNAHVGFAAGPHRCLGSNLARLELRLAIEEFHRRVPDYEITPGDRVVYTNHGVRGAIRLPITFPVR
ncbi:cytochrome P450 [Actinomadura rugatobispora]|uniref:Cytochrome P450 n=1 Tax=Actinomadura rugatobispora TaxID=1994 RepID=A0ABW0ZXA4_9ACTN|nr:cytochrome P450 [Actinomadura rugatobispora]